MDLYPVDERFSLNWWMQQLTLGEDITILFQPEQHLSYRAQNGEGRAPPGTGRAPLLGWHAPHREWRAPIRAVHSFLSRGNPTEPTETAKKTFLCALAERWWDTTHTFHIVGVEMTITPYDVYRLTSFRIDGVIPTFSAFLARVRLDREYLGVSLGATSADLLSLMRAFTEASQTTIEEATRMARAFLLYLTSTTLDCNTSQIVPALQYFTHAFSRRPRTHQREYLREFFDGLTPEQRVTRQLGKNEDLVPVPTLQFTLFPYEAPDEVILLWRASIPMLDWLDEDGDFEEYQQSLMSTLFPPPMALTDVPSTSGSVPAAPMGPTDIVLPSWSVPPYQADGSLREIAITRHTNVLGYPVPEDARIATHADLNYMLQLCGNMKAMMTDLSRDLFSRPSGHSNGGRLASGCELCPMMEEFGAIMGISNFDQILLPPKHVDPILLLDEVLSIPYRLGSSWSMNDGFDLHTLVDHFSKAVDEECQPEALVVAVLAGFFLTGDFSEIDAVVLDAIGRMNRENSVPMILGETLNGLDELKEGMCPYFKGNPLLL
uniref:Aminotransferase-like plant mobile domain-containing protein n=1 Tax=Fagus sylvatica TaxID=28930 RepID=A0A2N9FI42_FAGSY